MKNDSLQNMKKLSREQLPLVTIMIPTWNQEKYIGQAVESALSQDYPHLEIVVSDDYSSDSTSVVMKRFLSDKRLQYFRSKKRVGRFENYRKCLYTYARGDYVLNLDGDDYLIDPTYIRKAITLILRKKVSMVFAKQEVFIERKNKFILDKNKLSLEEVIDGNELFLKCSRINPISHLTTLYNRKEAIEVGFYKEDILHSDVESTLRFILGKKIGFIDQFVAVWRKHAFNESKILDVWRGDFKKRDINSEVEEIMKDALLVEGPYTFALRENSFSEEILDKWKGKMLYKHFLKSLLKQLILKNYKLYALLLERMKKTYPSVFSDFNKGFKIKALKLLLLSQILALFFFRYILKNESFYEDI